MYHDTRQHRLSLNRSADSRKKTTIALIDKIKDLLRSNHRIPLSTEDPKKALQGGRRHIVAALGEEKVALDNRSEPKAIVIIYSISDEYHLSSAENGIGYWRTEPRRPPAGTRFSSMLD